MLTNRVWKSMVIRLFRKKDSVMNDSYVPVSMPKIELPTNPKSREYLLAMASSDVSSTLDVGDIVFGPKEVRIMGYEDDGEPIYYDGSDHRMYGYSFYEMAKGRPLHWEAITKLNSLDDAKPFYSINTSALVTERCKRIIESFDPPDIEFIPTTVLHHKSGEIVGEMWLLNVFHWVDLFDLERSELSFYETVDTTDMPENAVKNSFRFGQPVLLQSHYLAVNDAVVDTPLCIPRIPYFQLYSRIFISYDLAYAINGGLPRDSRGETNKMYLGWPFRHGPGWPRFRDDGYQYYCHPETRGKFGHELFD